VAIMKVVPGRPKWPNVLKIVTLVTHFYVISYNESYGACF